MSKRDIPTSYAEASTYLGDKSDRPIANNTRLVRNGFRGGRPVALQLHQTLVVTWYENGETELRMGGWNTLTTRDRINRALDGSPWRVGTERGTAYLYHRGWTGEEIESARYHFAEGLVLSPDGTTDAPVAPKRPGRPWTAAQHEAYGRRRAADLAAREVARQTIEQLYRELAPHYRVSPWSGQDAYGADEADAAACSAMAAALRLGGDSAPTVEDYTAGLARMRERLAATR